MFFNQTSIFVVCSNSEHYPFQLDQFEGLTKVQLIKFEGPTKGISYNFLDFLSQRYQWF
jgi:hypothetical protein